MAAWSVTTVPDHPRSRGVYSVRFAATSLMNGSSPLARGLHVPALEDREGIGIIPARAGFTTRKSAYRPDCKDHPRSRGVYSRPEMVLLTILGSSPLARGLHPLAIFKRGNIGIIPARAGFTDFGAARRCEYQDHPRSRGVYYVEKDGYAFKRGSSPLARGLRQGRDDGEGAARIIPARAGFTRARFIPDWMCTDHPRSRGVYFGQKRLDVRSAGSSPLARGLRDWGASELTARGIIPARAGFTPYSVYSGAVRLDHPRSRGVYWSSRRDWAANGGSSPLARGLPSAIMISASGSGIIPARAGFTQRVLRRAYQ